MDVYVARQPIFDRKRSLFAYELLFRDGLDNFVPDIDGDTATSKLLSNSFFTIGIDKITGGKKAFINFTENLIINEIPLMFPRETTVIEVLEDVKPTPQVLESCSRFSNGGYYVALDDYVFQQGREPLIEIADIIKVDFMGTTMEQMRSQLKRPYFKKTRLLAEKVETYEEFREALNMGFEYFQGYFFCKPEILHGKDITSTQLASLRTLAAINNPHFEFEEIEKIITQDLSISYKLLRYINSAYFKRLNEIETIKQALIYMGELEIRRFVSLILLSNMAVGKPDELIRNACIRARFCELLGGASDCLESGDELFTMGMFSNINAILDQSMEDIMKQLPLSTPIVEALTQRAGQLGNFLNLIEQYEKGEWDQVNSTASTLCLLEEKLPPLYMESCEWANTIAN